MITNNCVIPRGCKIGKHCHIGLGTQLKENTVIPDYSTVVGQHDIKYLEHNQGELTAYLKEMRYHFDKTAD